MQFHMEYINCISNKSYNPTLDFKGLPSLSPINPFEIFELCKFMRNL